MMTLIISTATPGEGPLLGTILTLAAAVRRRLGRLVRVFGNRSEAAVLAGFDDRMLADIGLTRSDVRDAFAAPLWQDPTNLLRVRALERRLNRHGAGLGFPDPGIFSPPLAPVDGFDRPRTDRPARFTV